MLWSLLCDYRFKAVGGIREVYAKNLFAPVSSHYGDLCVLFGFNGKTLSVPARECRCES